MESLALELESVLEERGFTHHGLRFVEQNNNYAFTDGSEVFVKVSVLKNRALLELEASFLVSFGSAVRSVELLIGEAVPVCGGEQFAVFYRFADVRQLQYDELVSGEVEVSELADALKAVHRLSVSDAEGVLPVLSFERLVERVNLRESYFRESFGGEILAEEVLRYRKVLKKFMVSEWGAFVLGVMSDMESFVVCHGDAHIGNFVRDSGGEVMLVDYESVVAAPVEYDLTGLLLLFMHHGEDELFSQLVSCFGDIDERVLQGMLFLKVLSSSSFLLLSADRPESVDLFRRRVDVLERSFEAGTLLEYPL